MFRAALVVAAILTGLPVASTGLSSVLPGSGLSRELTEVGANGETRYSAGSSQIGLTAGTAARADITRYFRSGSIPELAMSTDVDMEDPTAMLFGVYPGGGNGEIGAVPRPAPATVLDRLDELRGAQPLDIHLYTAWSWHSNEALDADVARYTSAGYSVSLTIKYSPPAGREGDMQGFAAFVRDVVRRHASNPMVQRFVIGNEINVANGNPGSSDGPFAGVREAAIAGVLAAHEEIAALDSSAQIGFSVAVLERETDISFLVELAVQGGAEFTSAVGFLGLHVYPGLWPVGTGEAYADMVTHLEDARAGLRTAGFADAVTIFVLENGYPTPDETVQLEKLNGFLQAVCDSRESAGVSGYSWFDLWDADSSSDNVYAHYGLLRSDMSKKAGFDRYREIISNGCQ